MPAQLLKHAGVFSRRAKHNPYPALPVLVPLATGMLQGFFPFHVKIHRLLFLYVFGVVFP